MIEFALVAPLFLLIAMGLIVTGVVVTHQVQLTNVARDAARGLAVCGSAVAPTSSSIITNLTLPDGTACKTSNESSYASNVVHQVNGQATVVSIQVVTIAPNGTVTPVGATGDTSGCASAAVSQPTRYVQVVAQYSQPLFLPLVGTFLGTNGTSNRTLNATAVAQCEQ